MHVVPSVATYACRFHFGQALWRNIQRLGLTDNYKSGTEVGHWLHLFYGLSFLQPNDVSDAFAFDIMSCSPTSDKCDKFGDYFCSTYLETAVFPPSLQLYRRKFRLTYVVLITDPSPSIGISMRSSLHRILRSLFSGMTATSFPSLAEISTAVVHETAVLARSRLQLYCGIGFIGEFQRLLPLSALVLCIK